MGLAEDRDRAGAASSEHTEPRPGDPVPTVYVIDPDESIRFGLEELFRFVKLRVESFASGEEFLAGYDGSDVGCVVLEMSLPGISGLDLQTVLSARRIPLPVIALSARGDVETAVRALHAGAIDFIEKPYLPQSLMRRVREAIRRGRKSHPPNHDPGPPK